MHFSLVLAAIACFARAHALVVPPTAINIRSPDADKIRVKWILDVASQKVSVDIYAKDGQSKLLRSPLCQTYFQDQPIIIDSDTFATTPIILNISTDAMGHIYYAGRKYIATELFELNGGVYCTSMYNKEAALLDCQIPWTRANSPTLDPINSSSSCFPDGSPAIHMDLFSGMHVQERSEQVRSVQPESESEPVTDSTVRDCDPRQGTALVGNGNPKAAHLQVQISRVISCGDGSCTAGHFESQSYTIGWSLSGALPGGWISGGFSVSQTTTTGDSYSCNANAGQTVCVWSQVDHIAYKVERAYDDDCTGWKRDHSEQGILRSPQNGGTNYYCVRGTCRTQGERYWDPNDVSP